MAPNRFPGQAFKQNITLSEQGLWVLHVLCQRSIQKKMCKLF